MGLRDLPFWGRVAGELANAGLDSMGAKRCAVKGHKWRDVGALMLRDDGEVEELGHGVMQRCRRCGAVREKPEAEVAP